jgi:hypothetical protein
VCVIHHVDQWTIWAMSSNINHTHPILCVTYTIMNKCCHTYSVVFCCTILYLCEYIHISYSKLYSCLCQAQDYNLCIVILENQSFSNHLTIPNQCLLNLVHVLNYSTCKCANWVIQTLLKPSLVPKWNRYYLRVIVVTFTQ